MKIAAPALTLWIAVCSPASAISITIEYENPLDTFFTSEAQATLAKAASDVSYAITTTLSALSQDTYTGMNGGSSATVNWSLRYTDPTDGSTERIRETFAFAQDELVIRVGSMNLGGSTLGLGAPGSAEIDLSGTVAGGGTFPGAVTNMEATSNTGMLRGGPVLSTFSGDIGGSDYNLSSGYLLSALSFDSVGTTWNLSYANMPTMGQYDFYSVALHEIMHVVGVSSGQTWASNVSGTDWTGENVINLLIGGVGVLEADGAHVKAGLNGFAIIDGVQTTIEQEVLINPTLTTGTRKYITNVDLAFLDDMGWAVIPEPSHASLLVIGLCGLILRRKR